MAVLKSTLRDMRRGYDAFAMTRKTFEATIVFEGSGGCHIPLPFDPKAVFGKARAPVKVTVAKHTYRSTIASMGEGPFIPLRKSNREAAGLADGVTKVKVTLELDTEPRVVAPPKDLVKALRAVPGGLEKFQKLAFTHQREHVEAIEQAKKPETRERRILAAVKMILSK